MAINREMEGLLIKTTDGKQKAMLNWFGVHCTSVSSFNHRIHHDNKGVAAKLYEQHHPGTIAFFMQAAAGDVSPNYIWDSELKRTRGTFKDQYESAEGNGEIQFREAESLIPNKEIKGTLQGFAQFLNMGQVVAPAAHGVAFFEGTKEGPGVSHFLGNLLRVVSRGVKYHSLFKDPKNEKFYEAHFPKDILLDHRSGAFLGIPLNVWKKLPAIPEPAIEALRKDAKAESINTTPWVPEILPFQIIIIGPLLIAAAPGEITTVAAARLKQFILHKLQGSSISEVIISSYANAYMGYITTPEEYVTQSYEAGHTIYGSRTLEGILEGFEGLLNEYQGSPLKSQKTRPFHFPSGELALRSVP
jgi:neutral ceramidase